VIQAPLFVGGTEAAEAVRYGILIGFVAEGVLIALLSWMGAPLAKLLIGQDNRVSTSKTIAVAWTLVVAALLTAMVYANLLNHAQALNATNSSGVVGQYALLFGGPLGAAILAKGIVTGQVNKDPSLKPPAATGPSPADLVNNDSNNVDLGDFQYVLFNLVALFFVMATILHDPAKGLPHVPDVLLGLTSVSAAGYVGKKALPATDLATASIDPAHAHAGDPVTIKVTGLTPPAQPDARFWVRFGPTDPGQIIKQPVVAGSATLTLNAPALPAPPQHPVDVSLVTATGVVVAAGTFTYE
jgi:hypothetical protein